MIKRKKPMKRGGRIRPRAKSKVSAAAQYQRDKEEYLRAHPYCQIRIAREGLVEAKVIALNGFISTWRDGRRFTMSIPNSTEIHHRNKRTGKRLLDQRWWMACCRAEHDLVEANLSLARRTGFALPIQADDDGRWGLDSEALETPLFMSHMIGHPPIDFYSPGISSLLSTNPKSRR